MKKIYIFLAEGFEEIEGLTVVDLVRRVGIDIKMVSISKEKIVKGSHGIEIIADMLFEDSDFSDADMLVLPGGMPGTNVLMAHDGLKSLLLAYGKQKKKLAAICAAPSILGNLGLLEDKKAVCYPGHEEKLLGADVLYNNVVVDGNIITSRGLGTAIDFSLAIIRELADEEVVQKLAKGIIYQTDSSNTKG